MEKQLQVKRIEIVRWSKIFENNESRKLRKLKFYNSPGGCGSRGYRQLAKYGLDGYAVLGMFSALCQAMSQLEGSIRKGGVFKNSDGTLMDAKDIVMLTLAPEKELILALKTLNDIGWLKVDFEVVTDKMGDKSPIFSQTIPGIIPILESKNLENRSTEGEGELEGEQERERESTTVDAAAAPVSDSEIDVLDPEKFRKKAAEVFDRKPKMPQTLFKVPPVSDSKTSNGESHHLPSSIEDFEAERKSELAKQSKREATSEELAAAGDAHEAMAARVGVDAGVFGEFCKKEGIAIEVFEAWLTNRLANDFMTGAKRPRPLSFSNWIYDLRDFCRHWDANLDRSKGRGKQTQPRAKMKQKKACWESWLTENWQELATTLTETDCSKMSIEAFWRKHLHYRQDLRRACEAFSAEERVRV